MKLSIPRETLLRQLKINRAEHRAIFEEAVEGYKKEAVEQLNAYIERIKSGSLKRVYVSLPQPEEHTHDYDRIIALIEMASDDSIPLTDDEFAMYVQDDWTWKRQFIGSNSAYSMTAAKLKALEEEDED